ncbi:HP0495 family protein [Legionella spiritensis]|uniref:UPF0250 protein Lspi_1655 n=1 Tax=Legionella spiritensis TaxID=452 RepID=A0A0W0Z4R6_LEGSP|nr:DUF493 domain-containing protein [Legionella spiritensis]KTD64136.1 hypothetical protein Lspi_1655 [Legionella spiritensis]SNV38033.1 putative lipoate regulatory protein YbeD [Legionella spiritensis]VEG90170.1 putative lipoate regulatory protein YbeD [Legionella spiritensis]
MTEKQTYIEFPCHFPIKIIGTNTVQFKVEITTIINKHFPATKEDAIACKDSQNGNYLSITATVYVVDKPSLDALYHELTQHPATKMVL